MPKCKTKRIANLIVGICFLHGCATAYQGPKPDFGLRGKAAEEEIKKFTINESYWTQGKVFEMGPEKKPFTVSSLLPIMEEVSPEAAATLSKAAKWEIVSLVALGVGIGALVLSLSSSDQSKKDRFSTISLVGSGTSLGIGLFVTPFIQSAAASEFNRDLRNKFSPSVAFGWNY